MPAPLTREAAGTERVTVMMTPGQKLALQRRARSAGVTVSDYIRRQVLDSDELAPLLDQLRASTAQAEHALASALDRLQLHDAELAGREAAARVAAQRSTAHDDDD